jgi:hypothetical protein
MWGDFPFDCCTVFHWANSSITGISLNFIALASTVTPDPATE